MKYLKQDGKLGDGVRCLVIGGVTVASILLVRNDRFAVLSTFALLIYTLYFTRKNLGYSFLSVPFLYIAALGLFLLGLVAPWALGLLDLWDVWWFGYDDLSLPLALVALATVSIQLGMLYAEIRTRTKPGTQAKLTQPTFFEDRSLLVVGTVVILIGVIAYVVGFFQVFGGQFFSMTYGESVEFVGDSDFRLLYFGLL